MATLQSSFKYEGDPNTAPFETVTLGFKIPAFEFVETLINRKPFIERNEVGTHLQNLLQNLSEIKYAVTIPNETLIGSTDASIINFYKYLSQIGFANIEPDVLDNLSFDYTVSIYDEYENLFGYQSAEAVYSLATSTVKYREFAERQRGINNSPFFNEDAAKKMEIDIAEYVKQNILIINKNAFNNIIPQFISIAPDRNSYALLYIISHLTDVSGIKPVFKINTAEFKAFMKANFNIDKATLVTAIAGLIKSNFANLFDLPVVAPEVKTVDVKGTFTILAADGAPVQLDDFYFYDLSLEYTVKGAGGNIHPVSSKFDWNTVKESDLDGNAVPISFPTLIANLVNSDIVIKVKGYNGAAVWQNEFAITNEELQHLKIEVSLLKPVVLSPSNEPQVVATNKKLHGKVIELSGNCDLKDLNVLIQAKRENDTIWRVVSTSNTDGSGNFSMPYPFGNYVAAQALVSLTPNSPADIVINSDEEHTLLNETINDDFLYLLLKDAVCTPAEKEDDCDCHKSNTVGRLPDQEELINSDDYMQDIGGSCVNLSTPNRTISEYSLQAAVRLTDPDVTNYILTKDQNGNFSLKGGLTTIERKPVGISNPIYWQDAPDGHNNLSLYQAVSVATGHILHYRVVTKADGYSMGELLYSLPLAPGQKKQIVIFDQTHTLQASETQQLSQRESLAASLVNDVDINDTITGSFKENSRGGSSATTGGVSGGLGIAGVISGIAGVLGISGGFANADSIAWQNSSRSLTESFHEKMKNSITQNAQSYREMNASVVTTVQEGQRYGVTSEVIANHNHCHSLTMMYFEVLRHYAIYQELTHVEECLFIPLLMTDFKRENVYKWRDVLASHLLPMPSETYLQPFTVVKSGRQHPLLRAFDAIERIKTDYANVDYPDGAYDDEVINFITGEMYIRTNLPRPKTRYDRIKSFPIVHKDVDRGGFLGWIADGLFGKNTENNIQPNIDEYISVDANFQSVKPKDCIRVINFDDKFFDGSGNDERQWDEYRKILESAIPGTQLTDTPKFLTYYFRDRLISEWDSIFYNDIAPLLFETIAKNIHIGAFSSLDFSTTEKYKGGNVVMRLNIRGNASNKKRKEIEGFTIEYDGPGSLDSGLITLIVQNLNIRYSTIHYNGSLFSGFIGDDLIDTSIIYAPENANEKRNPKKEDEYLALKLIEHLNSNLEYYNKVLFSNLDTDRRFMLLDGFEIETFNSFGVPIDFRSLASVVKNELIGISGNSLIMPVAPGYKIDRTYIVEQPIEGPAEEIILLDHYQPLTPIPAYRVSITCNGVFTEAVQGACDACEKVKENTSQDWDKFRPDEPTTINPITTPVPTVTDWKAAFKDFATPIVNIQNAPAAPTPGAGLAGISDLLGKSDVFKDITGLDQNQKNAMQTYMSNQQNAKDFAQMAKDIFTIDNNTRHSDAIADSIRNSSELSDEEKAELLKKHYNQVIDGGKSTKEEKDAAAKNGKPTLTEVAARAEEKGKPVKASNSDAVGNTEEVEVGASDSLLRSFIIDDKITPDLRAFEPSENNKTGVVTLSVSVPKLPSGGKVKWSIPPQSPGNTGTYTIRQVNKAGKVFEVEIKGITPGNADIDVEVLDKDDKIIESQKYKLNIPQFVRIAENVALFDNALNTFNIQHLKSGLIERIRSVSEFILRNCNVRMLWTVTPFSENAPAHLPANMITTATFMDTVLPVNRPIGNLGITFGPLGSDIFNETIELYVLGFTEPGGDIDAETNAIVTLMQHQNSSDPLIEDFVLEVLSRLFAESMSHEIIHSLLGDKIAPVSGGSAPFHNEPPIMGDIMNAGTFRNFSQRTGLVRQVTLVDPIQSSDFNDLTLIGIDTLQAKNSALMEDVFPVRPA